MKDGHSCCPSELPASPSLKVERDGALPVPVAGRSTQCKACVGTAGTTHAVGERNVPPQATNKFSSLPKTVLLPTAAVGDRDLVFFPCWAVQVQVNVAIVGRPSDE